MKRITFFIMVFTVLSKGLGFIKDIVLSYFYGASVVTDAYLISLTIPTTILSMIGAGVTTGYIPIYSEIKESKGTAESNKFTSNLINIIILFCTVFMIIGLLFTREIVLLFASGFNEEALSLAITFTRINILSIYFPIIIYIFKGYLQVNREFNAPALIGIPMNIIIIISILLSGLTNVYVLSIGSLVAIASQLVYLMPFVRRKDFVYYKMLNIKDFYLNKMVFKAIPVIIGVSVNQINILVDRTIASRITVGGISALDYSNKLNLFIQGIFVLSITSTMYPLTSKYFAAGNSEKVKEIIIESINGVILLILPITVGTIIFSEEIIMLLFGRGAFDVEAVNLTSSALFFYSFGMLGFALREILSRAFFSMQDTKTPMFNAIVGMTLNIILNLILSKYLGVGGLALATSIAATTTTILMFISLRKKLKPIKSSDIVHLFFKIVIASAVMGFLTQRFYEKLLEILPSSASLLISIFFGVCIYFLLTILLKIEEAEMILKTFRRKFKKRF